MADCPFTLAISNNVVAAALCSPHLLYAFIWNFPKQWQRAFGRWSVQIFESLVRRLFYGQPPGSSHDLLP